VTIKISIKLVNELLKQAQNDPLTEVCGIIGAFQGIAKNCYPINNIANDSKIKFEMDPQQQIQAMKRMRDRQQELFAIYHSHPTTAATPSSLDICSHQYPLAHYLIVSLDTKGLLQINGFHIDERKQVTQQNLEIV